MPEGEPKSLQVYDPAKVGPNVTPHAAASAGRAVPAKTATDITQHRNSVRVPKRILIESSFLQTDNAGRMRLIGLKCCEHV